MNPQVYCRQVCKKSKSNFVTTFYFFGKQRRQALQAFYAFCRLVDDAVDQAPSFEEASAALQFWKAEVGRLYEEKPSHLVTQALLPAVRGFQIPKKYLDEIIAGCEMDLTQKTYATFEELERYCYRVASCVGLVCLNLFGVTVTENVQRGAVALGKALQITNILRDISSDFKRGRIYLPTEDLQRFSVAPEDLAGNPGDAMNLVELIYFEMDRVRGFFKGAWGNFPPFGKEKRRMLAATLMGKFYEAILKKISRDPTRIFKEKISLSLGEKLKITFREIGRSL